MGSSPDYPVIAVAPAWRSHPEAMGTRSKFWYRQPGSPNRWLFKFPREDTGEHWAEKIAAETASYIGVFHGRVELAEYDGYRGSATESFARRVRELRHGNEVLAATVPGYDRSQRFGQSQHTLKNIWRALDELFVSPLAIQRAQRDFAGYLVLDAVIGNTDRHHENWGLLIRASGMNFRIRIAPSFDHASSLGRELSDDQRKRRLESGQIGDYSERGRGGIYWSETDRRAPSPIELVRRSAQVYPRSFASILNRASALDERRIWEIVERIPDDWMSDPARDFAVALMCYNVGELKKPIQ